MIKLEVVHWSTMEPETVESVPSAEEVVRAPYVTPEMVESVPSAIEPTLEDAQGPQDAPEEHQVVGTNTMTKFLKMFPETRKLQMVWNQKL